MRASRGSVASAAGYLACRPRRFGPRSATHAAFPAEVDDLLARQAAAAAHEEEAARRERAALG